MKKILALLIAVTSVTACKKQQSDPPTQPEKSVIWKMNGDRQMWGYRAFHSHRSDPAQHPPTYTFTPYENIAQKIAVINDSTLFFRDTLVQHAKTNEYIEYIPKIFKTTGVQHRQTNLKYYYSKDSISYFFNDHGVSFHDTTVLYTK